MPSRYVLIDFENIQPESLAPLVGNDVKVLIFVGASQAKGRISFELSRSVQQLGANAQYVTIARSGPNAVDMHIAYFIGTLLQADSKATIHVVSGDTDFDPLLEYLRGQGRTVQRTKSIGDVAAGTAKGGAKARPKTAAASTVAARDTLEPIIKQLRSMSGKPATRKKLGQTIISFLQQRGRKMSDSDVAAIVDELIRRRLVSQNGTKVSYQLG